MMITQYSLPLLLQLWLLFLLATATGGLQSSFEPRIIGGWDAPQGRFPYMTSLLDDQGVHECGGSLIAPDVVLTAAHCQDAVVTAQVGRYNRSDTSESFDNFQIVARYVHPKYSIGSYPYDYMLLKLSGSSSRQVLALNHNASVPFDAQALTVMGFGLTQVGNKSSIPSVLQQVTVNVISNTVCGQSQQRGMSQTYIGQITPDMLCADAPQRDSCQGDSGGPLIVSGNGADHDVQLGHVSWGLGCAESAFPGVYARTSYGFAWIAATVCAISSKPPTEFRCYDGTSTFSPAPSRPPSSSTVSPAPTGSVTNVTAVIYLDSYPSETGWSIQDVTTGGYVVNVPSGTYSISDQTVIETVPVYAGRKYMFVIKDTFGDGINSVGYHVVLGSNEFGTTVLLKGSGNFLFLSQQTFTVPTENQPSSPSSNSLTPSPSPAASWDALQFPSVQQTGSIFLTIEIQLDQNPEQTSWRLDSLGMFITEVARIPPGSYGTQFQLVQTTMEIQAGRTYVFTLFDEGQNGIENGHVRLFSRRNDSVSISMNHDGEFGSSFQFTIDASAGSVALPASRPLGNSFLTLELRFDLYPNETGVVVEANDNGKIQFLLYRPPGYYVSTEYANEIAYEYIVLPQSLSNSTLYKLALTDTFSDGLCCTHNGDLPYKTGYTLYDGSQASGSVLVTSRFKAAPKEETTFLLPYSPTSRDLTGTMSPTTVTFAVEVILEIEGDPGQVGYYIQDSSGSWLVDRRLGTFSQSVISETIPLNEGLYYFGLVDRNGGGFNGTYQVRLNSPNGFTGRPPLLSGWGLESEALHQAFLVESFDSGFSMAVIIETDNTPNQTGFSLERLDVNGTSAAVVAQVSVGSYSSSHSIQKEPLMVQQGGLYRLVMLDGTADGMDGRIHIVLGGTDREAVDTRTVTLFGTFFESQGYYTFLAQKDEPAYDPPTNTRNLTLQMQFDALPMGVDWALLSDTTSSSAVNSAPALQARLFQGLSLVTYGPETPTNIDYTGRKMVETILLPSPPQGLQAFTLSMSFRVNGVSCPKGLSGSFELYDDTAQGTTATASRMLLTQGHFSNANQATAVFTLSSSATSSLQSAAADICFRRRRRRRMPWQILLLMAWPVLYYAVS